MVNNTDRLRDPYSADYRKIDGDSLNELVLARTDRILHAFQIHAITDQPLPKNIETPVNNQSLYLPTSIQSSLSVLSSSRERGKLLGNRTVMPEKEKSSMLRKGMGWHKSSRPPKETEAQHKLHASLPNVDEKVELIAKDVWVFDGQVRS